MVYDDQKGAQSTAALDLAALTSSTRPTVERLDLVVIAVTAHALTLDEESARRAGCDGFISKPYDITAVADAVGEVLKHGPGGLVVIDALQQMQGRPASRDRRKNVATKALHPDRGLTTRAGSPSDQRLEECSNATQAVSKIAERITPRLPQLFERAQFSTRCDGRSEFLMRLPLRVSQDLDGRRHFLQDVQVTMGLRDEARMECSSCRDVVLHVVVGLTLAS